jgi:hypothetical protein
MTAADGSALVPSCSSTRSTVPEPSTSFIESLTSSGCWIPVAVTSTGFPDVA